MRTEILTVLGPGGARLRTRFHHRGDGRRRPTLLLRTPYRASAHDAEAAGWIRRGFHMAVSDVRGRHESEGLFYPYLGEGADGAAIFDAVHDHRVCDGRIIAYGGSYAAHCARELTRVRPVIGLAALMPAWGRREVSRGPAGLRRQLSHLWWWYENAGTRRPRPGVFARFAADGFRLLRDHAPAELPGALGWEAPGWREAWRERTDHGAFSSAVPAFMLSGFADAFAAETRIAASRWRGPVTCVLGRWNHLLRDAACDHQPSPATLLTAWCRDVVGADAADASLTGRDATGESWELAGPGIVRRRFHHPAVGDFPADPTRPFPSWAFAGAADPRARLARPDQVHVMVPATATGAGGAIVGLELDFRANVPRGAASAHTFVHVLLAGGGPPRWVTTAGVAHGPGRVHLEVPAICERPTGENRLILQFTAHDFPVHLRDSQGGDDPVRGCGGAVARRRIEDLHVTVLEGSGYDHR